MNEDLRNLMRTAINLALPILVDDRESLVDCHTLQLPDGEPDLATIDPLAKPYLDEYDRAIDYCERAIVEDRLQP